MIPVSPTTSKNEGANLDNAPPRPAGMVRRAPPEGGMGAQRPPELLALQYTQQIVQSAQALGQIIPALAEPMANLVAAVEQLVPRAMAGMAQGGSPVGPPGVAPMQQPPPGAMQ